MIFLFYQAISKILLHQHQFYLEGPSQVEMNEKQKYHEKTVQFPNLLLRLLEKIILLKMRLLSAGIIRLVRLRTLTKITKEKNISFYWLEFVDFFLRLVIEIFSSVYLIFFHKLSILHSYLLYFDIVLHRLEQ